MNELQQLEKALAELLGWADIDIPGGTGLYNGFYKPLPRWTTNDAAAFQLMCAYKLSVTWGDGFAAIYKDDLYLAEEFFKHHENREDVVRVAIVKAVIAKLTAASGFVPTPCFGLEEAK